MNPKINFIIAVVVALSLQACFVSSCFITNCPVGGKRNIGSDIKLKALRQCTVCGPKGSGRCYGPEICCGSQMGCHIGSKDAIVCQLESEYPVPCHNKGGASCGDSFDGQCAADGICCSNDQCTLDENCRIMHGTSGGNILSNPSASLLAV